MENTLYSKETPYTYEELKAYETAKTQERKPMRIQAPIVFLAVSVLFFATRSIGGGIAFLILAALQAVYPSIVRTIRIRRSYQKNKRIWNTTTEVELYEDCAKVKSPYGSKEYHYEDFYQVIGTRDRLYLVAGVHDILIIDKSLCRKDLLQELENLV